MIKKKIKFEKKVINIQGGKATIGLLSRSLSTYKITNIKSYYLKINELTRQYDSLIVPIIFYINRNKIVNMIIKRPTTSSLALQLSNVKKGKSTSEDNVGTITSSSIDKIVKIKILDLNTIDVVKARKIIISSIKSLGLRIID